MTIWDERVLDVVLTRPIFYFCEKLCQSQSLDWNRFKRLVEHSPAKRMRVYKEKNAPEVVPQVGFGN